MLRKISRISAGAVLLGVLMFFFVTGGRVLSPGRIDWLMSGDSTTYYLSWQFFRHTPLFQWPLGANPAYGMAIGSSIVYTDTIPLLAFIFKPLNAFLPSEFQYFGLWIMLCFVFQSFFACKLLSLFTKDKLPPLIGSIFFTLAPVCIWRLHGHYALFAQWTLLAGLYLYLSERYSNTKWVTLLVVTSLIHAYLLILLLGVWIADMVQRLWLKQMDMAKVASSFSVCGLSVYFSMYAAGYFMLGGHYDLSGFGLFKMNLLSLIDPDDIWSHVLRDQPGGVGDYEGFNYLGLGIILLGIAAVPKFFNDLKFGARAKIVPLSVLCFALTLYSASNHVALGGMEILSYALPSFLKPLADAFRVSGRFFWPVYYLLYLKFFSVLFARSGYKEIIVISLVALVIQVSDSSQAWVYFRQKFIHPSAFVSPMKSGIWEDIPKLYKKIVVVPPGNTVTDWLPLSKFASLHEMSINTGYFARVNPVVVASEIGRVSASITGNCLEPDSVYIFYDEELWRAANAHLARSDFAGIVDNFRMVAPKIGDCKSCNLKQANKIVTVPR